VEPSALKAPRRWRSSGATEGFDAQAATDLRSGRASRPTSSAARRWPKPRRWCAASGCAPGTHLDLIGSFTPRMRESDAACFSRSRVFVDTAEALAKSGDLLGAVAEGAFNASKLQGTLAQLCRGERPGRSGAPTRSRCSRRWATALEDLAAAELVAGAMLAR
jgi:ornithine cyclodeaminase/alanine dehydrogenase-like protein (mu-crystallin family)